MYTFFIVLLFLFFFSISLNPLFAYWWKYLAVSVFIFVVTIVVVVLHTLGRMLSISFAWFLIRFDSTLGILSLLLICLLQIHYSKHLPFFSYLVTSGVNRTAPFFSFTAYSPPVYRHLSTQVGYLKILHT